MLSDFRTNLPNRTPVQCAAGCPSCQPRTAGIERAELQTQLLHLELSVQVVSRLQADQPKMILVVRLQTAQKPRANSNQPLKRRSSMLGSSECALNIPDFHRMKRTLKARRISEFPWILIGSARAGYSRDFTTLRCRRQVPGHCVFG